MSASAWINVLLAILLLAVTGWALRKWYATTSASAGTAQTGPAPPKLDVFKRLEPIERFAKWYYLAIAALIGVFALSLAARKGEFSSVAFADFLVGASVSFVVAAASTAIGCLLGFLFGIPKSLQRGAAAPPPPPPQQQPASGAPSAAAKEMGTGSGGPAARTAGPAFGTNTSLEEISDWLTKIIIGLGLVQFQTFITYLYNAALFAASFIAQSDLTIETTQQSKLTYQAGLASPFLFAVIIACLVASCLFAYLETRTRLARLFLEQKMDEDGITFEAGAVKVDFRDRSAQDLSPGILRAYLWPKGKYSDDRRKTLNKLLAELGIARDVRLILEGEENAELRKLLIASAEKKGISLKATPDPEPKP